MDSQFSVPKKSTGEYRKEVYAEFQKIVGREMTDDEHRRIKNLMIMYLKEHRVIVDTEKQITYEIICPKCGGTKKGSGHQFGKKQRGRLRAQQEVEKQKEAV